MILQDQQIMVIQLNKYKKWNLKFLKLKKFYYFLILRH